MVIRRNKFAVRIANVKDDTISLFGIIGALDLKLILNKKRQDDKTICSHENFDPTI